MGTFNRMKWNTGQLRGPRQHILLLRSVLTCTEPCLLQRGAADAGAWCEHWLLHRSGLAPAITSINNAAGLIQSREITASSVSFCTSTASMQLIQSHTCCSPKVFDSMSLQLGQEPHIMSCIQHLLLCERTLRLIWPSNFTFHHFFLKFHCLSIQNLTQLDTYSFWSLGW